MKEYRAELAKKPRAESSTFEQLEEQLEEQPAAPEKSGAEAFSWGKSIEDLYREDDAPADEPDMVEDLTWGCHAYTGSQNDDWCKKGGDKDSYLRFRFFEKDSECGACSCCSTPVSDDAFDVASATLTAPSVLQEDAITFKAGGAIEVRLFCKIDTQVSFTAFKLAPDTNSDWLQIKTHGYNNAWNLGANKEWSWSAKSASVTAKQGENIIKISARSEEGMKIKKLSLIDADGCYLGPDPTEAPTLAPEIETTTPPVPEEPIKEQPIEPEPPAEELPAEPVKAGPNSGASRVVALDLAVLSGLVLATLRM